MPKYQPLVAVTFALATGIAGSRHFGPGMGSEFGAWWLAAVAGLTIWWWLQRFRRLTAATCCLLVAVAFVGGAWHELCWSYFGSDDIGRFASLETEPACTIAILTSAPEIMPAPQATPLRAIPGGERSRAEVRLVSIRDGTKWLAASGRCQLLVDGHLLNAEIGDEVQIFAQLRRPMPPMNPGEFDFAAYARVERRLASLIAGSPDCVTVIERGSGWSPQAIVATIRSSGKQLLRTYIPPGQAGLAAAILLGDREQLPREELDPFLLTGSVHLLVVSGLNVAILATGLYAAMWVGWLPRRVALVGIVAVVVLYTLVAGAEPPVLRAAVLVVLVSIAAWTGRRGVAFNSLAAAAVIVLAMNPAQLFQAGTQLSFLCVAILIWIGQSRWFQSSHSLDPLDRLIESSRPWHVRFSRSVGMWAFLLLITSGAIWFATLPLVLSQFHVASPVSLVIAPLVWVLGLVAMWAGFITLACGWFVPFLAVMAGWVCGVSLGWLVRVVEWAESLPGGHFWAPGPAVWWLVVFYFGLLAVMLWGRTLVSPRWQIGLACLWILVGLVPPLVRAATRGDELQCTFVSVGHGACVVLETPDGQTLLYDAGSLGPPEYATQSIAGNLWERGILRIDGIILSHADVDHYNAVPGLLERFSVGTIYVSPAMFDWYGATGPSEAPQVLQRAIIAAGVPIREVWAGDKLRVGEVTIDVIHPPREGVVGSDNANSIVASIEFAGRRLLLPGDLETPGLEDVIAELPLDCDVIMAPHHGSRRSDPPGFAAWSSPEWVIVSGGPEADPSVEATYTAAGGKVLNTGKAGAIRLVLSDRVLSVDAFHTPAIR